MNNTEQIAINKLQNMYMQWYIMQDCYVRFEKFRITDRIKNVVKSYKMQSFEKLIKWIYMLEV